MEQQQIICKHMQLVTPLSDPKFNQKKIQQIIEQRLYQCFYCQQPQPENQLWLCLHQNCDFFGCQIDNFKHLQKHLKQTKMQTMQGGHCIFMNPISTQILCVQCGLEIFDFEQYGMSQECFEEWQNPKKIRQLFHLNTIDLDNNLLLKSNLSNPQSHWKNNQGICGLIDISNTSFINCILQIFSNITLIRKIFQRQTQHYDNSEGRVPKSLTKRCIFYFQKLIQLVWSGCHRAIRPFEIIQVFYQIDPSYRGYGFKDAYEFFKAFVNILHDEFKFYNLKQYDMKKQSVIGSEIQEEWQLIENINNYTEYSVISSIFKGKLNSQITCTQCKTIFNSEEDFMGISMEFPIINQKEFNAKMQKIGLNDEQKNKKNGFFQKFFNFNKEDNLHTINLYHCLLNFCETKNIKNQHTCNHCQNSENFQKCYQFISLPNYLCIHLQRFNQGMWNKNSQKVIINTDDLELKYFMKQCETYDQSKTQYELMGIVEHKKTQNGDYYRTIVQNNKNKLYYSYEDANVKVFDIKQIKNLEPFIIFYKLKDPQPNPLIKNLKSQVKLIKSGEMKLEPSQLAYLPIFWYEKLLNISNPGMIITSHLLCNHNKIKPDYFDCFPPIQNKVNTSLNESSNSECNSMCIDFQKNENECETNYAIELLDKQSKKVPIQILSYLIERYGGGKIISTDLLICTDCIRISRQIRQRRKLERELIAKYDNKITEDTFIVEENWMLQWKDYLYFNKKFFKRNFIKGIPPPKQIDNKKLLGPDNTLKPGLKRNINFRIVNEYIWLIFKNLYSSSSALVISDLNQNQKNSKPILAKADLDNIQEMHLLINEKKYKETLRNVLKDNNEKEEFDSKENEDFDLNFNNIKI